MKRILLCLIASLCLMSSSCDAQTRRRGTRVENEEPTQQIDTAKMVSTKTVVNFYIENSGSMKGYFTGNSKIKDIIKEYYDRIHEKQVEGDTITLNYINVGIINSSDEIKEFLNNCQSKCTASYTKIDDILSMAMKRINDSTVSIVVSDFCFSSDNSSFPMAMSGITELFTKQLHNNDDLSIAIIKYMSDFDGYYYPGRIRNRQPLPFYIWIFGNEKQVKRIVNSPIKARDNGVLFLQPSQTIRPTIITNNARMLKDNSIIVRHWEKERIREITKYTVTVELDLSNVISSKEEICNTKNYTITEGYFVESISVKQKDIYSFVISTSKPAPGSVSIEYSLFELPEWVEKSNFSGTGVPDNGKTLGVKYLIEGVYDAYHNQSNNIFETTITLK